MEPADREGAERVARVEAALEELERLPDERARDAGLAAVQSVLELYGAGIERLLELGGPELCEALAGDELVAHLLLVHGLHPIPVEERVARGLDEVRPYLESHGGGVELLGVDDGVARLRLAGTCDGCPSSAVTLKLAVEEAVHRAAPEIERVEAEGEAEERPTPTLGAALPMAQVGAPAAGALPVVDAPAWTTLADVAVGDGESALGEVAGRPVLFARVAGQLYAYRPDCAACGASLGDGALRGEELTCTCGARYDVRHAGRRLDAAGSALEPLPLLVGDAGTVRVAAGAAGA